MPALAVAAVAGLLALAVLGPCQATGPPAPNITQEQIHVINQSLDALHEEVAAARTPSTVPLAFFLVTLLLPLLLAVWLLVRAERSVIGHDETLRTLVRYGLGQHVVRHYLAQQIRPQLPGPNGAPLRRLPRPRRRHRPRRRRRRHTPGQATK